jgi:hypothetical protein
VRRKKPLWFFIVELDAYWCIMDVTTDDQGHWIDGRRIARSEFHKQGFHHENGRIFTPDGRDVLDLPIASPHATDMYDLGIRSICRIYRFAKDWPAPGEQPCTIGRLSPLANRKG